MIPFPLKYREKMKNKKLYIAMNNGFSFSNSNLKSRSDIQLHFNIWQTQDKSISIFRQFVPMQWCLNVNIIFGTSSKYNKRIQENLRVELINSTTKLILIQTNWVYVFEFFIAPFYIYSYFSWINPVRWAFQHAFCKRNKYWNIF
jgi:hypothetical protein